MSGIPLPPAVAACLAELQAWAALPERASLSPRARAFLAEPSTLRRYAVARNGDAAAAIKALEATVAWREAALAPPLGCRDCDANIESHCFFPLGFSDATDADPGGRLIVYACAARALTNEADSAVNHMLATLEHAWASRMGDVVPPTRLCWIVDFRGFGFSHAMQGKTSNAFLSQFGAHLPERLERAVLLSPPGIFDVLLALIRPFVDARTLGKVLIIRPTAATVKAELAALGITAPGQVAWLSAVLEMDAKPGNLPPLSLLGDVSSFALPHLIKAAAADAAKAAK